MKISVYKRKYIKKHTQNLKFCISTNIFELFVKEILIDIYSNFSCCVKEDSEYVLLDFSRAKGEDFGVKCISTNSNKGEEEATLFLKRCLHTLNFEKEEEESFLFISNNRILNSLDFDFSQEDMDALFKKNNYFTFEGHAQLALFLGLYDCDNDFIKMK